MMATTFTLVFTDDARETLDLSLACALFGLVRHLRKDCVDAPSTLDVPFPRSLYDQMMREILRTSDTSSPPVSIRAICDFLQLEISLDGYNSVIVQCAKQNNLPVLRWAHTNGAVCTTWACAQAAKHGHFALLRWLLKNGAPIDANASAYAAGGGHIHILEWLWENKYPIDEWTYALAAYNGHIHVLSWLRSRMRGLSFGEACAEAIHGESLPALRWLHDQGAFLHEMHYVDAAHVGNVEILQWLHDHDCPMGSMGATICAVAAEHGHLAALQWARDHGAVWDTDTCTRAAEGGHFEILRWARANEAPWSVDTYYGAEYHPDIRLWLRANGCPQP